MNAVLTLMRLFPYWGLVVALTFFEFALHYRRRGNRLKLAICGVLSLVFLGLVGLWFAYRGDLNSGAWVRAWLGP